MLRADGAVTYYFIQHINQLASGWSGTALDYFLFEGMSFEEKGGELASYYRNLISKQGASTPLWQKFGINGFVDLEDAKETLKALQNRRPNSQFRVARRMIMQHTEVIS